MKDLRQAAEMALKALEDIFGKEKVDVGAINALRQALDLQTAIEKGTEAWADVPNASQWVDELRGNDKPPVKTYAGGKPNYCTPEVTQVSCAECGANGGYALYCVACAEKFIGGNKKVGLDTFEPLERASPTLPQRTWVGLTDKEIAECIQTGEGGFVKLLATYRAIEARLKEKNT